MSMPMHYFIPAISFLFLFYVTTATALVDDDVFLAFVKDEPNFEEFCKDLDEKGKLNTGILSYGYYKNAKVKQKKASLIQLYEARLGLMYLMRENWKCAGIRKEIKHEKTTECEKLRKYLDILYGYLFLVYAEGTGAAGQMPPPVVKPVFILDDKVGTLIDILEKLSQLSLFFFVPNTQQFYTKPTLSNEGQMNYALSAANSNGTLRKKFDKNLKQMLTNTKQNEAKEKTELNKIAYKNHQGDTHNDGDKRNISDAKAEYGKKFDIFLNSPFSGKVRQ